MTYFQMTYWILESTNPREKSFPSHLIGLSLPNTMYWVQMYRGRQVWRKKSNQINTMHRKHPLLYRCDYCYQASTESPTCYLHGKHSIIVRVSLTHPVWGGISFNEHVHLPLTPTWAAQQRHKHLCQINLFSILVLTFAVNYNQKGLCIQAIQSWNHRKCQL